MKTIDKRGYVWKKGKSLVPTFRAFAVVNLLETYFADLVDYQFTAAMEDQLDEIAEGRQALEPWLRKFYFGDESASTEFARRGLEEMTHSELDFDFAAINSLPLGIAPDGEWVSVRSGRYGPYLVHGEERVSIPEATEPDSLTVEHALELLSAPSNDRQLGVDEATGLPIFVKAGRYGPYVQVGEVGDVKDPNDKPKTASLFSSMDPATLTIDEARLLLSLPREVGRHPLDNEPVLAQNGRYGPYITWGKETRSLDTEAAIFSVTMDEAVAILAQPKARGRRTAAGPLKDLGVDPVTKLHVVVKTGKFGNYVTDGEVNAPLRIGDTIELLTLERASELLAERRNAEPSTRPRKATASKTTKKAPAKKAVAKKATARKAVAKKATGATKRAATAQGAKANAALLATANLPNEF
jgi:DNA topoisomerase-1